MSPTRAMRRVISEPALAFERLGEHAIRLPWDEVRAWSSRGRDRPVVNQRELRVASLRRSGHHAVLDWIMRQLPGSEDSHLGWTSSWGAGHLGYGPAPRS